MSPRAPVRLLALLAALACACMPAAFNRGEEAMRLGDARRAISEYEAALKEKPGDGEITAALGKARHKVAQELVQQAHGLPAEDLWARYRWLDEALGFDPTDAALVAEITLVCQQQELLQRKVNDVYAALNGDQPLQALELYKQISRFKALRPELAETERIIAQEVNGQHLRQGLADLAAARWDEARKQFSAALAMRADDTRAKAGLQAVAGAEQLAKRQFAGAMQLLREALNLYPAFEFAQQRLVMARRGMAAAALADAQPGFERAVEPPALVAALEAHGAVLAVAEKGDPERAEAESRIAQLRSRLAKAWVKLGQDAAARGPASAATALFCLREAHLLDPDATARLEPLAAKALKAFNERIKLNLALHVQAAEKEWDSLAGLLHETAIAALDKAQLPGLNVVSRDHLRDLVLDEEALAQGYSSKGGKGVDLETSDVILLGTVTRNKLNDVGRNRPVRKSSKWIAGTKDVRNPAYGDAKAEVHQAEQEVKNAERDYELAKRQAESAKQAINNAGGGALGSILGAIGGAVVEVASDSGVQAARRRLGQAEAKMASTPETIEENVIKSYFFKEYNVSVEADMRVSLRLIDRRTSVQQKAEVVQATVTRTGMSREDVENTDQNGFKNIDGPLPDPEEVRSAAQEQLIGSLSGKVVEVLQRFGRARFAQLAKAAQSQRNLADQLENELLYLELAPPDDPLVQEFEEFCARTAGLSFQHRKVLPFADPSAKAEKWPAGASD